MSTITIVTLAGGGNVPPAEAIARELIARGHGVQVLGQEHQRTRFEAAGTDFAALGSLQFNGDHHGKTTVLAAVNNAARLASSRAIRAEVADNLARTAPDAVLVDVLIASAVQGARDAGIPTAVLFHTYYEYWLRSFHAGPVGWLIRLRGVNMQRIWESADAQLVTCEAEFDPAARRQQPAGGPIWVGAITAGTPPVPSAEPPLILVSLSSTWFPGQTAAYQNIITALGTLPARGLVTLGGVTQDRAFDVPANVEIRDYADHAEIMPTVSLVVGHGGHATTFSALAHSKPLVMLPMHPLLDQPMVAASVVNAGAGLMLKRTASSEQIAHAIATALVSTEMRLAAEAIGAHLRTTDPAGAAATQLLALSPPVTTSEGRGRS